MWLTGWLRCGRRTDISQALGEDEFDPVDLINKICRTEEARENVETYLSSILMKLQLYVQQVNASLEETSQNVLSNMPKVLRDTQLLQQEALALKEKMQTVKKELENVEKGTTSSIQMLEKLDKIKTEYINKTEGQRESDNWAAATNEIEDIFESGDVEKIADTLCGMQKSLSVLINTPDYEDKKLQLEGLKNRLEALTSPKLVQAFTAGSLDQSKIYVDVFTKMDRLPQLIKYYYNCQKVSLAQEWRKTIEFAQDENVIYWLRVYYDKLLSVWHDQVKWCNQVFPNLSLTTLVELHTDLLQSLDPSIGDCIEAALKQQSNSVKLSILMELKQMTRQFAVSLSSVLDTAPQQERIADDKAQGLARAVYAPFIPYINKYGIYESSHLGQQLNALEFAQEDLSDTISALSLSVSKVMDYANEANKRCKLFTEGCAYPSLVKAFNTFFNNYQEKFKIGMKQLNKRKVKHEDWNLFQMCLTLMQTTGEFLGLLEQFEKSLLTDIINVYIKLQTPEKNVFLQYKTLLLTPAAQSELQEFITTIQKEEKSILDSTMKSVQKLCSDLHRSTYEVIFAPIFTQLLLVRKAPAWSANANKTSTISSDLPDFSFAPQEYITQVGQYLMTLPQHLEPFLLRDNPSLTKTLKAADSQYSQESCESGFTNILLGIVAKETCQMFQDQTWGIYELNAAACKQLATDIDYLGNILEELGLSLSENLQQMSQLLRIAPEDYQNGSVGCNPRVVAAVRQMRNITSSG
ncbi:conserved oligomeric Golgi complex subunit 7 isoform X1 [Nasonia vitripennis]|uniref:Conserved oligomeric Golgi complex subunit 7 n=1 Tax=Nasonia vitripennis TaxID=7425 RepID=A0A7M7H0V6_NASVI|nr:conserved oligomeric Golgi complex subunit 7 isoform X1 [Nasonia vitripennis]